VCGLEVGGGSPLTFWAKLGAKSVRHRTKPAFSRLGNTSVGDASASVAFRRWRAVLGRDGNLESVTNQPVCAILRGIVSAECSKLAVRALKYEVAQFVPLNLKSGAPMSDKLVPRTSR
jgi:hypothetical protein